MTPLDPVEILSRLGRRGAALIEPVAGGADAAIWRVEQGGSVFALRVLGPNQTGQAKREVDVMTLASRAGLPVPAVVSSAAWQGRPVILLEWAPGRTMADALLESLGDIERAAGLGLRFGEMQAAIHRLAPPPGLRSDWLDWPVPNTAVRASLRAIEARAPVLLHLDFHLLNVLVENDRITAVLDWANAHGGDPRADLARTLVTLQTAPLPPHVDQTAAAAILASFEGGWREGYEGGGGSFGGLAPFCWWAGASLEQNLAPQVGNAAVPWLDGAYMERIRNWTGSWKPSTRRLKG